MINNDDDNNNTPKNSYPAVINKYTTLNTTATQRKPNILDCSFLWNELNRFSMSEETPQNSQDLTVFVQSLLQQMVSSWSIWAQSAKSHILLTRLVNSSARAISTNVRSNHRPYWWDGQSYWRAGGVYRWTYGASWCEDEDGKKDGDGDETPITRLSRNKYTVHFMAISVAKDGKRNSFFVSLRCYFVAFKIFLPNACGVGRHGLKVCGYV